MNSRKKTLMFIYQSMDIGDIPASLIGSQTGSGSVI
jgi:hypothetical protein